MKINPYRTFLLLLVINLLLLFSEIVHAKGGGGGREGGGGGGGRGSGGGTYVLGSGNSDNNNNNNEPPFFTYVNGRRICTSTCVATFVVISVGFFACVCYLYLLRYCRYCNNKISYHNTTDGGENGINNVNDVNGNNSLSLPPSYESTNPAPDPSYKSGRKHEATSASLHDAREFARKYPPNEILPTPEEIENIIIQDGYKAWKFIPDDIISKAHRTLISDDGMAVEFCKKKLEFEGLKYSDIIIQTNYPFFTPDIQAVNSESVELDLDKDILHYFEITLLNKVSKNSTVAIGITTKPYPYFRLPGWNKNSVGYHSDDGRKFWNDEFGGRNYGPAWGKSGDIIGCGYKPNTGEIFFTKNGKFLGIAFAGLRHIWYPSIGSDGNVKMKINFGDDKFAYKDAQGFGIGSPSKMTNKEKNETK